MNRTLGKNAFAFGLFALVALVLTGIGALAYGGYYPPYPNSGVNTIGTQWQETTTYSYDYGYEYGTHYYDYVAPARAGGFYGSGVEFLTGLRSPVYAPVAPVYYANYYQPVCGWPTCFTGGAGYPRARASQFPQTGTPGGVFGY